MTDIQLLKVKILSYLSSYGPTTSKRYFISWHGQSTILWDLILMSPLVVVCDIAAYGNRFNWFDIYKILDLELDPDRNIPHIWGIDESLNKEIGYFNHAGPNGECLNLDEIVKLYGEDYENT